MLLHFYALEDETESEVWLVNDWDLNSKFYITGSRKTQKNAYPGILAKKKQVRLKQSKQQLGKLINHGHQDTLALPKPTQSLVVKSVDMNA